MAFLEEASVRNKETKSDQILLDIPENGVSKPLEWEVQLYEKMKPVKKKAADFIYSNNDAITCLSNILDIGDKTRNAIFILSIGSAFFEKVGVSRIADTLTHTKNTDFYILVLDGNLKDHRIALEYIMSIKERSPFNFRIPRSTRIVHGVEVDGNKAYLYFGGENLPPNIEGEGDHNYLIQNSMTSLREFEKKFKYNADERYGSVGIYDEIKSLLTKFQTLYPAGKILIDNQVFWTTSVTGISRNKKRYFATGIQVGYNFEFIVPMLQILFSLPRPVQIFRTNGVDLSDSETGLYELDDPRLLEWPKKTKYRITDVTNLTNNSKKRRGRKGRKTRKQK
jgi:hypothetical protein